jgi:hypothetical protein
MITKEVYCSLQVEGLHCWPGCPIEEVSYLRDPHRHLFHIKAYVSVTHGDRDVEFIVLKHWIQDYLKGGYYDDALHLHDFGSRSCEMIAEELIHEFGLSRCEVSEDGENGAVLQAKDKIIDIITEEITHA